MDYTNTFALQSQTELFVASITETDGASKSGKKPATTFEFDRVFGPASTQAEVFDEVAHSLDCDNIAMYAL